MREKSEKEYKNLVFDIGNVLVENRYTEALQDFGMTSEDADRMCRKMFIESYDLWDSYDRGILSRESIREEYRLRYPDYIDKISWIIDNGEKYNRYYPELYGVLDQIQAEGYGIYIISNYPKDFFHRLFEESPLGKFLKKADGIVVSCNVNLTKPNPKIYYKLYESFLLRPEESLFFDDRKTNTEAAKRTGMNAVDVKSPSALKDILTRAFLKQGEASAVRAVRNTAESSIAEKGGKNA